MSFPLYDTLITSCDITTDIDKNKLIKWINQMDQDGHDKIYALIRYHSLKNENEKFEILPYHAMSDEGGDLIFDLDRFPIELQNIIFEFSKLHIKHMKDNQKMEKIRKKKNN